MRAQSYDKPIAKHTEKRCLILILHRIGASA